MTAILPYFKGTALQQVRDYVFITCGLILYAFGVTCFMMPYEITTGGLTGISLIIYYATGLEVQISYLTINIILLILAVKILGWKFCIRTIYGVLALTVILWGMQRLARLGDGELPHWVGQNERFMACVIGALFEGSGLAVCFLCNGSTGGTDIIAAIVNKYRNISLGNILMLCDVFIISSNYFIFHDVQRVVFGFATLMVSTFTLDYIMSHQRQSVQFMIFSRNYSKIADAINQTGRGVTVLDGTGWYTKTERKVLVCLARKSETVNIFRLVKSIDPYAFLSMANVQGVYGEGFDHIKTKTKSKLPTLVFASNNQHKLQEVRQMLGDRYEIRSLSDIGCNVDIPETGSTFAENALQKARFVKDYFGFDCFADDTGLEVNALGGKPGVRSARYASTDDQKGHDSQANMAKLLAEMDGQTDRRADFRTVIALVTDTDVHYFEGQVDGTILTEKHGTEGFGYDRSFAEMTSEEKNAISHRGRAIAKLAEYLTQEKK